MDVVEALLGILDRPVMTLLLGLGIGYWFDWRQDRRRRDDDRRQRRIEDQRNMITELQLALVEALSGYRAASLSYGSVIARAASVRLEGGSLREFVDTFPDLHERQWYQDWLLSLRKISILLPRLTDTELHGLTLQAIQAMEAIEPDREQGLDGRFERATTAVRNANERAGQFYRELDDVKASPWHLGGARWPGAKPKAHPATPGPAAESPPSSVAPPPPPAS